MKLVQFLILESGRWCNYAERHPRCPTLDPLRFSGLDTRRELDESTMVQIAIRAYQEFGFQGLVGFHYYNEPLLERDKIMRVIARIRTVVPRAGFVLWTNGSLITTENAWDLNAFSQIYVTDYDKRDYTPFRTILPHLYTLTPNFDNRRETGYQLSDTRCVRPYTEFIVDCYGNVHMCCTDWQGKTSPGNVFTTDLFELVRRFQNIRAQLDGPNITKEAPETCWRCVRRWPVISSHLPAIAEQAKKHIQESNNVT